MVQMEKPVNPDADSVADDFSPSWRPDGADAFMSNRVTATNPQGACEISS